MTDDYLNFRADLENLETASAVDEVSLWSAMFGALLLKHVPMRPGIKVLDVGCGTGFPLLELAQRLGPVSRMVGIDPWAAALDRARFKLRQWNLGNVEIRQMDAVSMDFPDDEFDLVVSNLGLNNFDDPVAALTQCHRVMKPGARLVLTTNLQGHMWEFYEVFKSTLAGNAAALSELEKHVAHRATIDGMKALLKQVGLQVVIVHEESHTMRFVDGSALLRHHLIKIGFLDAWKRVVDPPDLEAVFARLEQNLNRIGPIALTIPMAYVEAEKARARL